MFDPSFISVNSGDISNLSRAGGKKSWSLSHDQNFKFQMGHVGGKNNSEKAFWEFDSQIMSNFFLLFWHQHGRLITRVQLKNRLGEIKNVRIKLEGRLKF